MPYTLIPWDDTKPKVKRFRRPKSDSAEKRVHHWIESVQEAKAQLRAEGTKLEENEK